MEELSEKEIKEIEVSLLAKLDSFCATHGISYFIHGGTLLGAVRHKGFIPWDDDIDVSMPRDDYEKFKLLVKESSCSFGFIDGSDHNSYRAYGKIYDQLTVVKVKDANFSQYGLFIDIFPLDNLSNNKKKALKFVNQCHRLTTIYRLASFSKIVKSGNGLKNCAKNITCQFVKITGHRFWINKLNKKAVKFKDIRTRYISNVLSPNYIHVYEKEWFKETVRIPFETIEVNAPAGYKKLLQTMYGDYMKLPPAEKRVSHHDFKAYKK